STFATLLSSEPKNEKNFNYLKIIFSKKELAELKNNLASYESKGLTNQEIVGIFSREYKVYPIPWTTFTLI
ncbi:MAG: hypothetical protein ACC658_12670, partial [Acidimicrobiia bacterium]